MDDNQDMSDNDKEIAAEVVESLGEPTESVDESHESTGQENKGDPLYVQKRLKQQKRAHDRELRDLYSRMEQMQSQLTPQNQDYGMQQSPQEASGNAGGMDDAIHKAVSFALQHRDMEERKVKDAENQRQLAQEYSELNRHLDNVSDKYDDFDDVVRGESPFTATMRDASLMLPKKGAGSAGEVLYYLGKNPEELSRIAKLPAWKQGNELVSLSHALHSGGEKSQSQSSRPLGQIKSNPVVNSVGVTEKTPVSDIRSRMKKGMFK